MENGGSWTSEREVAIGAARSAGKIVIERFGQAAVRMKGHNDPVTDADVAAQREIERIVRRSFPSDGFLGEEDQTGSRVSQERRWIVDPIDGTINYVHGFPFFAVSIGFEIAGEVKVGVIFDPVHNELFCATRGAGATCNHQALRVSAAANAEDAMVVAGLPSNFNAQPDALPMFGRVTRACRSIRRLGSAALALGYLAAGRVDGFYSNQIRSWDVAAGIALVREAGGTVTDLFGKELDSENCTNLLATNGLIHAELLGLIAQTSDVGKRT